MYRIAEQNFLSKKCKAAGSERQYLSFSFYVLIYWKYKKRFNRYTFGSGYQKCEADGSESQYLSIADNTGTIRLLKLPRHLEETNPTEIEDMKVNNAFLEVNSRRRPT